MGYSTIKEPASAEFVEKKSRFIGYIAPVKTAEDAASFIAEIKRKHWDATHNVSAYLLKNGQKNTRMTESRKALPACRCWMFWKKKI